MVRLKVTKFYLTVLFHVCHKLFGVPINLFEDNYLQQAGIRLASPPLYGQEKILRDIIFHAE